MTATDSGGLSDTDSVLLHPQTVALTFMSTPSGLRLVFNGAEGVAPFTRTVIRGSKNSISAITPQTAGKSPYRFVSWSDGGAQTHDITANTTTTYKARYERLRS
jgi:hypothetical protein